MLIVKKILLFLVALVVVLAVVGFLLPRNVHVERSTTIAAPAATVFALVDGFQSFQKWSPWAAMDPGAKYTYTGPRRGAGAKMSWQGDPNTVGSGSQEILESRPFDLVRTNLDFGDQGAALAQFTLAPDAAGTKVTWGFDSDLGMNPLSRYFGLLFDRMIGPDYEKGLASLKALAESLPPADFASLAVEEREVEPATVAYVPVACAGDDASIAAAIGTAYGEVGKFMAAEGLQQAGAPLTINRRWSEARAEFDAAIPVDRLPAREIPADAPVKVKDTYEGKVLKVVHKGPYGGLGETHRQLVAYGAAYAYESAGPSWEEYASDPGNTPEAERITNVYLPVK